MTNPPVQATEALEKPPVAKRLRSRWIADDDTKPRLNVSNEKAPRQFLYMRKLRSYSLN